MPQSGIGKQPACVFLPPGHQTQQAVRCFLPALGLADGGTAKAPPATVFGSHAGENQLVLIGRKQLKIQAMCGDVKKEKYTVRNSFEWEKKERKGE